MAFLRAPQAHAAAAARARPASATAVLAGRRRLRAAVPASRLCASSLSSPSSRIVTTAPPAAGRPRPSAGALAPRARRSVRVSAVAMSPISDGVADGRIPVTIITGFLGSGKTTLLNNVLRNKAGRRIAVIENEFGEIDIDSELVARAESLDAAAQGSSGAAAITVLSNGCLCCSVRGDLILALNALWERRAEFDHIIIETTGLANPAPVIQSLYVDEDLPHRVRLDGVVTVVDAANAWRHLKGRKGEEEGGSEAGGGFSGGGGGYDPHDPDAPINEAVEQVAYADRIVLNKIDLIGLSRGAAAGQRQAGGGKGQSAGEGGRGRGAGGAGGGEDGGGGDEESLDALEARLRAVNQLATVVRAVRGDVDVDYVLGVGGFDLGRVEEEVARVVANPAHGEPGHVCGSSSLADAGGAAPCGHEHGAADDGAHAHSHGHSHAHAHAGEDGAGGHAHAHDNGEKHDHGHGHSHAENPPHGAPGHVCGSVEGGGDCGHEHGVAAALSPPAADAVAAPPSLAFRGAHSLARITAARHDDRVSSLSVSVEGEMDLEKVNFTMGALLEARSEDLFRMKGILAIRGMEQRYVFQAVHALFEGSPDRAWRENEPRVSRMVLIGRELDADAFREAFERCLATEGGEDDGAAGEAEEGATEGREQAAASV